VGLEARPVGAKKKNVLALAGNRTQIPQPQSLSSSAIPTELFHADLFCFVLL
jgi:hypothetical protein